MQLKIKETPHRGHTFTWYADDKEDFCLKLIKAYPKGHWDHDWSYEQFVYWLRSDLKDLSIEWTE